MLKLGNRSNTFLKSLEKSSFMKKVYLNCTYVPGMFSNEYFVKFKGSEVYDIGFARVDENFLTKKDDTSGLVKATLIEKRENISVVVVPVCDNGQSGTFSHVPNEEIIENINP